MNIYKKYAKDLCNDTQTLTPEEQIKIDKFMEQIDEVEYKKWEKDHILKADRQNKINSFKIIKKYCKKENIKLQFPQVSEEHYYTLEKAIIQQIKENK